MRPSVSLTTGTAASECPHLSIINTAISCQGPQTNYQAAEQERNHLSSVTSPFSQATKKTQRMTKVATLTTWLGPKALAWVQLGPKLGPHRLPWLANQCHVQKQLLGSSKEDDVLLDTWFGCPLSKPAWYFLSCLLGQILRLQQLPRTHNALRNQAARHPIGSSHPATPNSSDAPKMRYLPARV